MGEIAILGCGPAGLLAAWAAHEQGFIPDIISQKVKSEIPGSQRLHQKIPGVTPDYPDSVAQVIRLGTAEGYAEKVYGDPARYTGWPHYDTIYNSWNVYTAYDKLWAFFENRISDHTVMPNNLTEILNGYDLVLSTLPMPTLCHRGHNFEAVPFWIKTLPTPQIDMGREIYVYNGLPLDSWYRWSILGGKTSIEGAWAPPVGAEVGQKAIDNDCDCWPGMVRLGRWAQWKHGILMHDAYLGAIEAITHTKIGVSVADI